MSKPLACLRGRLTARERTVGCSHGYYTVTAVADWSASKEMVLNADKCEVTFFSTNSHEANWQPTIIANNTRLHHKPLPKFLGLPLLLPLGRLKQLECTR